MSNMQMLELKLNIIFASPSSGKMDLVTAHKSIEPKLKIKVPYTLYMMRKYRDVALRCLELYKYNPQPKWALKSRQLATVYLKCGKMLKKRNSCSN